MEFSLKNDIAYISIDDGKANIVNHQFVDSMTELLERARKQASVAVLQARPGMFSAGFDLKELQKGPREAEALVSRGMALLTQIYAHPQPLVAACDGHAIGMGAFLLLASDIRVGSTGKYNITLPETAIGMPFNPVLMTLIKDRLSSRHQTIAVLQSKPHSAEEALAAGFLDRVTDQDSLLDECQAQAENLSQLPGEIFAVNKEDLRSQSLQMMRESIV
jgi:enoyl-CoA hydratase